MPFHGSLGLDPVGHVVGQVGDARERARGPSLSPVPFRDGHDGAPVFGEIVFEHPPHPLRGLDPVFLRLVFLDHVHGEVREHGRVVLGHADAFSRGTRPDLAVHSIQAFRDCHPFHPSRCL